MHKTDGKRPTDVKDGSNGSRKTAKVSKRLKEKGLEGTAAEDGEEKQRGSAIGSHPLQEISKKDVENKLNIFKHYNENAMGKNSTSDSHRKESSRGKSESTTQGSHSRSNKKLEIPSNLNLKENQVDFLRDVQNVLILFSDLKSKVERLNRDKQTLKDDLRRSIAASSRHKQECHSKSQQLTQALGQLNASQQENQVLVREMNDLKARLAETQDYDRLKVDLQTRDVENASLRLKVKQLQVDQNVLQEIIKEMIYDKEKNEVR